MNRTHNCGKVIRRNISERVIADSYIVMMKQGANMSEMVGNFIYVRMCLYVWYNYVHLL